MINNDEENNIFKARSNFNTSVNFILTNAGIDLNCNIYNTREYMACITKNV